MLHLKKFVLTLFVCLLTQSAVAQGEKCILDNSNLDNTIKMCNSVINSDNKTQLAEAYAVRCAAFALQGEPQIGIEDCNMAIELNPQLSDAYRFRGNTYVFLNEYDKAYDNLSKAIELNPQDAKALSNRASLLLKLERDREAATDADAAILVDPKLDGAYITKALVHARKA